jgi:hypothetical protein
VRQAPRKVKLVNKYIFLYKLIYFEGDIDIEEIVVQTVQKEAVKGKRKRDPNTCKFIVLVFF